LNFALQKTFGLVAGPQQLLDPPTQSVFSRASRVEVCRTFSRGQSSGCAENSQLAFEKLFHEVPGMLYQSMRKTKLKGATLQGRIILRPICSAGN
jgi:hypothetical protein